MLNPQWVPCGCERACAPQVEFGEVRSGCVTNVQSYRMFFCSFLRMFRFSRRGKSCVVLLLSFFAVIRGWFGFISVFTGTQGLHVVNN